MKCLEFKLTLLRTTSAESRGATKEPRGAREWKSKGELRRGSAPATEEGADSK